MNERRFVNPSQPQTLYSATLLLYINAVLDLLSFGGLPLLLAFAVAEAGAGFGIANEKKWGYGLGIVLSFVRVGFLLLFAGTSVFSFPLILNFMFDILLVGLLVHPMSRDYQRIWFR